MYRLPILFMFLVSVALSGQEVKFYAEADAKQILLNSTVNVTFTLDNAQGSGFTPPRFDWFDVVSGPMTSSSTSIINGRRSSKVSYTYTLMAKKVGKFNIGGAIITYKNRRLSTKAITIEVVEGGLKEGTGKDVFVKLQVSDSTAVIGQQLILNYVLYHKIEVQNFNVLDEQDYDGFFVNQISNYENRAQREIIDGEEYYVRPVQKMSLYPQQTGNYEIGPLRFRLGIPSANNRRNSFFFSRKLRYENVVADAISINVGNVPGNAPVSFSGAVGKFRVDASVNKNKLTTDDAIILNIEIRGDGDGKTVQAPTQNFGADFEMYDAKLIREDDFSNGDKNITYKNFEYLIVPKKVGNHTLRPQFTYFDTDSDSYRTLYAGPFYIQVTKGSRTVTTDNRQITTVKELADIKTKTRLKKVGASLYGSPLHMSIFGLGFLSILAILAYKYKLVREASVDPEWLKQQQAEKVAISRLTLAKEHMVAGRSRDFYDEVSKSINGYVADKIKIPTSELTKENLLNTLLSLNVNENTAQETLDLILACEMALFAGQTQRGMEGIYEDAVRLISAIEQDLKQE